MIPAQTPETVHSHHIHEEPLVGKKDSAYWKAVYSYINFTGQRELLLLQLRAKYQQLEHMQRLISQEGVTLDVIHQAVEDTQGQLMQQQDQVRAYLQSWMPTSNITSAANTFFHTAAISAMYEQKDEDRVLGTILWQIPSIFDSQAVSSSFPQLRFVRKDARKIEENMARKLGVESKSFFTGEEALELMHTHRVPLATIRAFRAFGMDGNVSELFSAKAIVYFIAKEGEAQILAGIEQHIAAASAKEGTMRRTDA